MGKIFYLLGKSCSGKDTIYKRITERYQGKLRQIVLYTTRPIRNGEENGREYFFVTEEEFCRMKQEGKVIEDRAYNTIHGLWRYFMADDDQLQDPTGDWLMIGVLQSFISTRDYFGDDRVIPVFIDLDDGVRLQRALERERRQETPKYQEMCRRYLADAEDFSEDKIAAAGITQSFINNDLEECIGQICEFIDSRRDDGPLG